MAGRSHIMAACYSYSVILEPQEGGGFTVPVPALPEVVTEGDTEQEALANAEEAICAILEYRREQGMAPLFDAHPEIRHVWLYEQRT
jgi:antitoxin HicB